MKRPILIAAFLVFPSISFAQTAPKTVDEASAYCSVAVGQSEQTKGTVMQALGQAQLEGISLKQQLADAQKALSDYKAAHP